MSKGEEFIMISGTNPAKSQGYTYSLSTSFYSQVISCINNVGHFWTQSSSAIPVITNTTTNTNGLGTNYIKELSPNLTLGISGEAFT
jgi:hypothetical protein